MTGPLVVYSTPSDGAVRAAYSHAETAELLGISLSTVKQLVRDGRLVSIACGQRAKRVPAWSIQQLLDGTAAEVPA